MLIEFNVSHFLSFRDKSTFSLVKANSSELPDANTFAPDALATPELLKSGVVYGANASGKSNFIKAIQLMKALVKESASDMQAGDALPVTPFLLDESDEIVPSEFEVTFVSQGTRYQYGFSATSERIIEEWLYAYPEGRAQKWIVRAYDPETDTDQWGSMGKLTGKKSVWQAATRPNALFLSTAIQLNNQQLQPVFDWFSNTLWVVGFGRWHPGHSIKACDDEQKKSDVMRFLKAADTNIDDIELARERFDVNRLGSGLPDQLKSQLEEKFKDETVVKVKTSHVLANGKKVLFDLEDESDGTQKIFALAGPWLDALKKGYTLVIDELHDNLHPLMVKFLVELFHNKQTNPKNAQLIFTTHDTSILNQMVFRRDQVWFCEKDKAQASQLYPLTDFSPRKQADNLEKSYLLGRYGALPYLKSLDNVVNA